MDFAFEVKCAILLFVMNSKKNKSKHGKGRSGAPHKRGAKPQKPRTEVSLDPGWARPNLYGFHAVREAWLNEDREVSALYVTEQAGSSFEEDYHQAKRDGLSRPEAFLISKEQMSKLCPPGAVHQGIAMACSELPELSARDLAIRCVDKERAVLVMLDQVTDPHNVGAILRSASAFGADGVIMQSRHAPDLEGVLAKTACGALDHIGVAYETNLSRAIEQLKEDGFFVVGLDERGDELGHFNPAGKTVLVLGAEGPGLRRLIKENCDQLLRLPTQGAIQSLNVSNAAVVSLYALISKG